MTQPTITELKDYPSSYESPRDVGDVLIGEDVAHPLIEASSSGNDVALQSLLSQPQWIEIMLENPHCIYDELPKEGSNNARWVMARQIANLERALEVAARNGQAGVVSILLAFAKQQALDASDFMTRSLITTTIAGGHAAVLKALASADANVVNLPLAHGTRPLYEAARLRKPDVVAVLLELGADPLHPVEQSKRLASYNSSLLSRAAFAEDPRMTEMLLEHGTPIVHTGALHTAAGCGRLDTMRVLMRHGADVDETLSDWANWAPMHFAAWKGRSDAMALLEQNGARSDLKDKNGKTPAQLLLERTAA
jgi:ankyrin repeat protein